MTLRPALGVLVVEDDSRARAFFETSVQRSPQLFWLGSAGTVSEGAGWLARTATIPGRAAGRPRHARRHRPGRDPRCRRALPGLRAAGGVGVRRRGERAREHRGRRPSATSTRTRRPRNIAQTIVEMKAGASPISPMIAAACWPSTAACSRPACRARPEPEAAPDAGERALLSAREHEVLTLIARGFSYAEIARLKGLSVHTVQTHIKNLYGKLAVHSKSEAVFEATRLGLLSRFRLRRDIRAPDPARAAARDADRAVAAAARAGPVDRVGHGSRRPPTVRSNCARHGHRRGRRRGAQRAGRAVLPLGPACTAAGPGSRASTCPSCCPPPPTAPGASSFHAPARVRGAAQRRAAAGLRRPLAGQRRRLRQGADLRAGARRAAAGRREPPADPHPRPTARAAPGCRACSSARPTRCATGCSSRAYAWRFTASVLLTAFSLIVGAIALALWLTQVDATATGQPRRDGIYLWAALAEFCWAIRVAGRRDRRTAAAVGTLGRADGDLLCRLGRLGHDVLLPPGRLGPHAHTRWLRWPLLAVVLGTVVSTALALQREQPIWLTGWLAIEIVVIAVFVGAFVGLHRAASQRRAAAGGRRGPAHAGLRRARLAGDPPERRLRRGPPGCATRRCSSASRCS
jgi:DNA-binding CsgD family transcriptional regulator